MVGLRTRGTISGPEGTAPPGRTGRDAHSMSSFRKYVTPLGLLAALLVLWM
jgi:hypothetical protein